MEFIDKLKFSSVCGIYCETECCIYKAYKTDNESMRRQLALILLNDAERWREIRCDGCKGEPAICWGNECAIKNCAYANQYEFCIQCKNYPCEKLQHQQKTNDILKKLNGDCKTLPLTLNFTN